MVAVKATAVLCEGPSRIDDIIFDDVVGGNSVPEIVTLVKVCVIGVVISKVGEVLERMVDNVCLVEVIRDDVADVEMSTTNSADDIADDVTDDDLGEAWRLDETVRAESDDDVLMLDAVDDEAVVKDAAPSTYGVTVGGPTDDEPVLEDVIDILCVEIEPVS